MFDMSQLRDGDKVLCADGVKRGINAVHALDGAHMYAVYFTNHHDRRLYRDDGKMIYEGIKRNMRGYRIVDYAYTVKPRIVKGFQLFSKRVG